MNLVNSSSDKAMESVKFTNLESLKFMNLEGMTLDSLPKLSVPLPQDEEVPEVFCPLQSGKPLSSESKQIILNVFIGLRVMFPTETIEGSIRKTSKLTGCSVRTVYRIRKETKENSGKPTSPLRLMKTAKRKRKTRKELYSDYTVSGIRNIVQGFYQRNEVPTVKKIMQAINADDNFPNLSESTTSRLLKDIGLSHFLRSRDNALLKKGQQPVAQKSQPEVAKCHHPGVTSVWCPPKQI